LFERMMLFLFRTSLRSRKRGKNKKESAEESEAMLV
jgi:hypothetical protein